MGSMAEPAYTKAPAGRRFAAGLLDAGIWGGLAWALRRRDRSGPARALNELGAVGALLEAQVPSPGKLLLGLRTVDRRTGARVAPWRTGVLVGTQVAGRLAVRRLVAPPDAEDDRRREAFAQRLPEIARVRAEDPARGDAEYRAAAAEAPSIGPYMLRFIGPAFIAGQLNRRLQRRLAPTVTVLRRDRADAGH
jgi:hypothetical protein